MNKLEEIIASTRKRVLSLKEKKTIRHFEESIYFNRNTISLRERLTHSDESGIIAEFKRQSPSKGPINLNASVVSTIKGYEKAGASAVSILTEPDFFLGNNIDLTAARVFVNLPILRKDFIVDEIQILESKAIGADVILLIASVLSKEEMQHFTNVARDLGLEILVEIRDKGEIENIPANADVVGVNNRNLKTFSEGIEQSKLLSEFIPKDFIRISESAIDKAQTISELQEYGYKGFLIGEHFMRNAFPEKACKQLVDELKSFTGR